MKSTYLLLVLLLSLGTYGKNEEDYSEEVAIGYARFAIIEWSILTGYKIDRKYLDKSPTVLSGVDDEGVKIIMVLFPTESGSYEATYTINNDGYMERHSTGDWRYSVQQVKKEFTKAPFLPGP